MKSALIAVCLCVLMTAARPTNAAEPSPAIAAAILPFIQKHAIAGAVTLVADDQHIIALNALGDADVERHVAMHNDNLFWIASMTKPITAAAVLMLEDEGKLSIDDPVGKYIPELADLKTADGRKRAVTIKHLLTHTSGMGEATSEEMKAAKSLADLIPSYAKRPLGFTPGERWQYCQSGINTLARIVEIQSGQSFADFVQKRLLDPLGMKDTTFYPSAEQVARLARSYKAAYGKLAEAKIFILEGHDPASRDRYPAANGGLFSTAEDYTRFCQMLLGGGSYGGKQYLKPETVKRMSTIQTGELKTGFTEGNGWGLGVCVVRQPQGVTAMLSPGIFGHGGAYGTQAWIDPVKKRIYILMVQRADFPNSDDSDVRRAFQEAAAKL